MSTTTTSAHHASQPRLHTIGAVCERLRAEFPDVSISKIRYLEDQGLLRPRRTRGGYRLFSDGDIERLETILRLQRDEFLPLRVIRQTLDAQGTTRTKRRQPTLRHPGGELDLAELCARAGIAPEFARRLEEYDLVSPRIEAGERIYRESDVEIAAACGRLARHGLDARHLRAFRTAAGRQSALLEQLVATGLRSRDLERRKAALEDLETLAGVATELAQHLLVRDLREASER
jgi:DNA-binding transcriptional MerR regulator